MKVRVGETFVLGTDKRTVGAMLAAADRAGVNQRLVRMQQDGLIVPNEVADEAFGVAAPEPEEAPLAATTPLASTQETEPTTSAEPVPEPEDPKPAKGKGSTTSTAKKAATKKAKGE